MKNLLFILSLFSLSCKAQNPIYSLQSYQPASELPSGSYIKDTYNDFNNFEGTWKYENSNQTLILVFQKKVMYYDSFWSVYKDLLIGEYQYIDNTYNINTTDNINVILNDPYEHNLSASRFIRNSSFPSCSDCTENDRRVKLAFTDPGRPWVQAYIVLRYINQSGTEYLHATIFESSTVVEGDDIPGELRVPIGTYLLVKQ